MANHVRQHEQGRDTRPADYWPLISSIVLTLLAAGALQLHSRTESAMLFMHHFMGLFLVIYCMFKIFDLSGYAIDSDGVAVDKKKAAFGAAFELRASYFARCWRPRC